MMETITDTEKLVLDAITEYLENNRTFRFAEILPHITSRFASSSINLNIDGIKKNMANLMRKKFIVEGSKFTKETVLLSKKRIFFLNFIKRYPGCYLSYLKEQLGVKPWVIASHLEPLLKFGHIKSVTAWNNVIYYDSSKSAEQAFSAFLLLKKKTKKILAYLEGNDIGTTKTQISKDLGMHPNTLNRYLQALVKYGHIVKKKISANYLFFLS